MYNILHNVSITEYAVLSIRELFITVQLVNDVMTTGATIDECGKVLLVAGVNCIYAATVALADF